MVNAIVEARRCNGGANNGCGKDMEKAGIATEAKARGIGVLPVSVLIVARTEIVVLGSGLAVLGVLRHRGHIIDNAKEAGRIQKDLGGKKAALDERLSVDDSTTL